MQIVSVSNLRKYLGGVPVIEDVSFRLRRGDRMVVAGRNGAGKTTLLRMLAGESTPDSGELHLAKGSRIALHDQRPPRERGLTLREYVLAGLGWMLDIEAELASLEARMADGDAGEATLRAYADAQANLESAGGYRWREGAEATLRGLGFGEAELDRELSTFSGGELTRASLARALASKPDLLLLDEPTNHLDLTALEWLENYLPELGAAVALVSHDRWFLESVGTSVLELERGRGKLFEGTWHGWRAEKARRELAAGRQSEKVEAEIARMERFVERFRAKATKARQAQDRAKKVERLKAERKEAAGADASLQFSFGAASRTGRVALEMEHGRVEAGERVLLDDADMWVEAGEKVALVGANGSGKTTLIETLAGDRPPAAGKLRKGHNVELGYLSQHTDLEAAGAGGRTVLEYARQKTGLSEGKTRPLLGRFLFSGSDVDKRITDLSGGEARRLSLAILVSSGANFLVLDEPTNHLDLESREALEEALVGFGGTVLIVSHDRALLEAVGDRAIAIEDRDLRNYPGGWSQYSEARAAAKAPSRAGRSGPAAEAANGRAAAKPKNGKPKPSKREDPKVVERKIEHAEQALKVLEDELADPGLWADEKRAERSTARHARAKAELEALYERWERVAG
ncbi:ABC-F family ATP-binding cassette domain-containing protein [Thermoleophilia bacterium SCSIO 60948]|nr:ABC-F family ATP-binding cassette domain-containing protein [Thermoleophilia bacterium SCSIO 60948]